MKLPSVKGIKWNYLALAFAVPVLCFLFLMLVAGYAPFGKYSMLYSDCYHQYFPFFKAFRNALRSGQSLLWNWDVGMGLDYLGLISYYLASPLNLLSVLMPESWMLGYFSLLTPIKLGLASLFFGIFLKKLFGRDDLSLTIFGTFYGMCAWAMGYQWNIMWVDSFALLPLVALGTVLLLKEKKFLLYTFSLFLAVISNYYIGFFICIFVLLLFICYQICRRKSFGRLCGDFVRIGVFTVIAIGMTTILTLPALSALRSTQSSVNSFPEHFSLNITAYEMCAKAREAWTAFKIAKKAGEPTMALLWTALKESFLPVLEGMRQAAGNVGGGLTPSFKEGLPNLYCGVGSLLFSFVFLTCKQVKLRDKLCSVFLLLFFLLSFVVRQLDYIWHGFHFTNMIPYRFSFLFSFVMLYMAYKAWTQREHFHTWQVVAALVLSAAMIYCSDMAQDISLLDGDNVADSWLFLLYNGSILIAVVAAFCYGLSAKKIPEDVEQGVADWIAGENRQRRANMAVILLTVMAVELILNLVNFGVNFSGTNVAFYPRGTEYAASMIRYMHEREENTLFYRAETTHSQTLNDGALNNYNGVSTFTSSANVKVTEFMRMMGYGAKNTYNRYCYEEASPVSNLFLNLKYMIERSGDNKESSCFTQIHRYGDVSILHNNYYLPLGFLAEEELADVDFTVDTNGFRFQNALMKAATGLDADLWWVMTQDEWTVSGEDVTVTDQTAGGRTTYKDGMKGGIITYTYYVGNDGFMCVSLDFPKRNSVTIWKNGEQLYSETMTLPQMMAVTDVVAGDVVEIKAKCQNSNESGYVTISAAILDMERFEACYNVLAESTLELTEFETTYVAGTIECDRDGLLYTSIPQNGNWSVKVDGEDAEVVLTGDVMVGVLLTEGEHEVEFIYHNAAFAWGWKISLLCVMAFGALVYLEKETHPRGGKYKKEKR